MMLSPVAPPSSLSTADRPGDMLDIEPCPGSTTMPCVSIADSSPLQGARKDDCCRNPLLHGVSRRQHLTYIIFGRPIAPRWSIASWPRTSLHQGRPLRSTIPFRTLCWFRTVGQGRVLVKDPAPQFRVLAPRDALEPRREIPDLSAEGEGFEPPRASRP